MNQVNTMNNVCFYTLCCIKTNLKAIHNPTHKKTILDFAHSKFLFYFCVLCFTVQAAKNVHLQPKNTHTHPHTKVLTQ